ncbi:MAG: glycine zipper domain-containing protein [Gammaproteobacteria bacterium]
MPALHRRPLPALLTFAAVSLVASAAPNPDPAAPLPPLRIVPSAPTRDAPAHADAWNMRPSQCNRAAWGALAGGLLGGVLGDRITDGERRGIIAGSLVGAVLGRLIGREIDATDRDCASPPGASPESPARGPLLRI